MPLTTHMEYGMTARPADAEAYLDFRLIPQYHPCLKLFHERSIGVFWSGRTAARRLDFDPWRGPGSSVPEGDRRSRLTHGHRVDMREYRTRAQPMHLVFWRECHVR